jgi:hypothetical protein
MKFSVSRGCKSKTMYKSKWGRERTALTIDCRSALPPWCQIVSPFVP